MSHLPWYVLTLNTVFRDFLNSEYCFPFFFVYICGSLSYINDCPIDIRYCIYNVCFLQPGEFSGPHALATGVLATWVLYY